MGPLVPFGASVLAALFDQLPARTRVPQAGNWPLAAGGSGQSFGLAGAEHVRKVHPWAVRLDAATDGLEEATNKGDVPSMASGIEDVSFWIGRLTCDVLSAADEEGHDKLVMEAGVAILRGHTTIRAAKKALAGRGR